jgi:hypothetical protein
MTIIIDDAGYGDLLFGVVIGAYRPESGDFAYDVVDVKYFQPPLYAKNEYINEASHAVSRLINKLELVEDEKVTLCRGSIFDQAFKDLSEKIDDDRLSRGKIEGEAQRLTELTYLNELRNLGYEPLPERTDKWAKSFFHMLGWLRAHPEMMKWAKTGWPRLKRYKLKRRVEKPPYSN